MRLLKYLSAVGTICALLTASALAAGPAPRTAAPSAPTVNLSAFARQGKLAFLWHGKLYVLDGTARTLRRLPVSGTPQSLMWSHDGRWLAYLVPSGAGATSALWVTHPDGTAAHRVTSVPGQIYGATWSPAADLLATIPVTSARRYGGIWVINPSGAALKLAASVAAEAFAWAPHRSALALSGTAISAPVGSARETVYVADVTTRTVQRKIVLPDFGNDAGVDIAGWWPDESGVLYWVDPYHSASIAADGLQLYSLQWSGGKSRLMARTLRYPDWFAPAPSGSRLAVVKGGSRPEYFGKQVALCGEPPLGCDALIHRSGLVTVDPAWSPDGNHIAYVQAEALRNTWGFKNARGYRQWVATRTLWTVAGNGPGPRQVVAAGLGVYDPMWTHDGRGIMFVRGNALWLDGHVGVTNPMKIVQLWGGDYGDYGYYGYIDWQSVFAWYRG